MGSPGQGSAEFAANSGRPSSGAAVAAFVAQLGRGSQVVVVGRRRSGAGRPPPMARRVRSASAGGAIDQAAGSALATRVGEKL